MGRQDQAIINYLSSRQPNDMCPNAICCYNLELEHTSWFGSDAVARPYRIQYLGTSRPIRSTRLLTGLVPEGYRGSLTSTSSSLCKLGAPCFLSRSPLHHLVAAPVSRIVSSLLPSYRLSRFRPTSLSPTSIAL